MSTSFDKKLLKHNVIKPMSVVTLKGFNGAMKLCLDISLKLKKNRKNFLILFVKGMSR